MVSGPEIRRRKGKARRKGRERAAEAWTIVLAVGLAFVTKTRGLFSLALCVMAALLIYALFQLDWINQAESRFIRVVRAAIGIGIIGVVVGMYGAVQWPPIRRHELSANERQSFEKPLKDFKRPQMSIHLYCAPEDEVDCEYAAKLIPLFGEGGWDVATTVDRITMARPESGIVIGLHGTVKPEDEPNLKWDQGEWTRLRPEEWAVRQAFVNIGIQPDSTSGAVVPENQINIYVGHERDDESAPTAMTREFENLERQENEDPSIKKLLGEK